MYTRADTRAHRPTTPHSLPRAYLFWERVHQQVVQLLLGPARTTEGHEERVLTERGRTQVNAEVQRHRVPGPEQWRVCRAPGTPGDSEGGSRSLQRARVKRPSGGPLILQCPVGCDALQNRLRSDFVNEALAEQQLTPPPPPPGPSSLGGCETRQPKVGTRSRR